MHLPNPISIISVKRMDRIKGKFHSWSHVKK
jgi:hypothetical protein